MMKPAVVILFLSFIFTACDSGRKEISVSDSSGSHKGENIPDNTPMVFKGLYILGKEVNQFIDCTEPHITYWINDNTGKLDSLYKEATSYASYPYESVYIEMKGHSVAGDTDHKNILVVTDVLKVEAKNFRTACYDYEFIAIGNEPFWAVDIIPSEKRIVLKDMSIEKIFDFAYNPPVINGSTYIYETVNNKNQKIKIIISKQTCSDGMSDRIYNYSSEITIDGRAFKGCAIKKGETFPDPM